MNMFVRVSVYKYGGVNTLVCVSVEGVDVC